MSVLKINSNITNVKKMHFHLPSRHLLYETGAVSFYLGGMVAVCVAFAYSFHVLSQGHSETLRKMGRDNVTMEYTLTAFGVAVGWVALWLLFLHIWGFYADGLDARCERMMMGWRVYSRELQV
jgi:hypothetical protein